MDRHQSIKMTTSIFSTLFAIITITSLAPETNGKTSSVRKPILPIRPEVRV